MTTNTDAGYDPTALFPQFAEFLARTNPEHTPLATARHTEAMTLACQFLGLALAAQEALPLTADNDPRIHEYALQAAGPATPAVDLLAAISFHHLFTTWLRKTPTP